jgi:hypothetical protein
VRSWGRNTSKGLDETESGMFKSQKSQCVVCAESKEKDPDEKRSRKTWRATSRVSC